MSSIPLKDILCETYSTAGKNSLKRYNCEIKRNPKKKINKMNLLVNSYISSTQRREDSLYIKPYFKKKKFISDNFESTNIYYKERNKNLFQGPKYVYHQNSINKMNLRKNKIDLTNDKIKLAPLFFEPNDNSPNKIKHVLNWKKSTGRASENKEKEDLYKNYSDINLNTNNYKQIGFIDMSKQTQRDDIFLINGLRNKMGKKYVKLNLKLEKEKWKKFCNKPLIARSPFSSDFENSYYNRISILSGKNTKKKRVKNLFNIIDEKNKTFTKYKRNSIIDFEKNTGRQDLFGNMIKVDNTPKIILYPNYNSIEERVKMMVVYKNKEKKKEKKELRNINWEEYYSITESFENLHGNKLKSVPNFKQMIPRSNDNQLPSFMNGIHNRMYEYNLEMNLTNDHFTDRNEDVKIARIDKIKQGKNKKEKSKDLLKKFINLYAELYNPKKSKIKIKFNKIGI